MNLIQKLIPFAIGALIFAWIIISAAKSSKKLPKGKKNSPYKMRVLK